MGRLSGVRIVLGFRRRNPLTVIAALTLAAAPAWATAPTILIQQESVLPRTEFGDKPLVTPEEPVLLEAMQVDYQQGGLIIASGNVAVTQGETIILADTLAYDQEGDVVIAQGNVSIMDPSGNVYFADEVELKQDLKTGVVQQFKARFNDDSLIAASRGKRLDENRIELFKAVYSPCHCIDDETKKPKSPQWAIKADRALIDQEAQQVVYDNVFFNVYDVPVLYSPYLSHATPGADSKSGFLMPEYLHTDNIGSVYKVPFYYAISPDRDMTITPIYTSQEGLVMASEYRQKFDRGSLLADGSITSANRRDAAGDEISGQEARGHINAHGRFEPEEDYRWGFDIRRTTDDTYLRRYNLGSDTLLTSKIYAEAFDLPGMNNRSYASIIGLAFQGLSAQDNQDRIPVVLPLAGVSYQSDPGLYNSRFTLDGNIMALYRDLGDKSRRLSATAGWELPYITDDGQMIEFNAQLRGDVYHVADVALSDGTTYDGATGRLVPQVSALWHYPFINRWSESSSFMIEPVAMMAVSPGGGNPEKIPNEDSAVPEFTDTNLFDPNRFAGYDRVESGPRVSYGLRGQMQFLQDKYIDWLFGQSYRVENDRNFPFTNDLVSYFSDYVGKLGLTYYPISIAYRFRLDRRDWVPQRQEVDASYALSPFNFSLSYLSLKNDPVLANREVISAASSVNLTKQWSWTVNGTQDLELNQMTGAATGLTFTNECTSVTGIMMREFTRDRDIEPSTMFLIRLSLKNLE